MKKLLVSSICLALAPSGAWAAAPESSSTVQAVNTAPSAERVELARRFIAVTMSDEVIETASAAVEEAYAGMLAAIMEDDLEEAAAAEFDQIFSSIEPITRRRMPELNEAYAQAYARKFSEDELRQLIAFVESPAGRRYLTEVASLEEDPAVIAAREAMWAEIEELFDNAKRERCAQRAAALIAAGEQVTCPYSQEAETLRS